MLLNGCVGDFFRTTLGVWQGCSSSQLLFNMLMEKIMQKVLTPRCPSGNNDCFGGDAVDDAERTDIPLSSMYIGGIPICFLRFVDDIDLLGGSGEELQQLTERLE